MSINEIHNIIKFGSNLQFKFRLSLGPIRRCYSGSITTFSDQKPRRILSSLVSYNNGQIFAHLHPECIPSNHLIQEWIKVQISQ